MLGVLRSIGEHLTSPLSWHWIFRSVAEHLGSALTLKQMGIMSASALTCFSVQRFVVPRVATLCFGEAAWTSASASDKQKASLSVVSGGFSILATALAAFNIAFPHKNVVVDPLYGSSLAYEICYAIAAGFFGWNLVVDCAEFSVPKFMHHFLCFSLYFVGQRPFQTRMGSMCMLYEASTPPLCVFNVLQIFKRDGTELYRSARKWFAALFFLVRIAFGIPVALLWWKDMLHLLSGQDGRTLHSNKALYGFMVANVLLNGLNVYWFCHIVRGAIRAARSRGKTD
eukprot:TRINITY_DN16109_c0_g1_i1.p1 TRINITY_DN16109_c0_g1~~TRINITY_DN16109_c0_g1_i1.p1  ORF type:complete len:284 (-),score=25.05 TRINITY_DN16109_c0_g1_i1:152-1003(-)